MNTTEHRLTKTHGPYYSYEEADTAEEPSLYTGGTIRRRKLLPILFQMWLLILCRVTFLLKRLERSQLHVTLYGAREDRRIHMQNENNIEQLLPCIAGMCFYPILI